MVGVGKQCSTYFQLVLKCLKPFSGLLRCVLFLSCIMTLHVLIWLVWWQVVPEKEDSVLSLKMNKPQEKNVFMSVFHRLKK